MIKYGQCTSRNPEIRAMYRQQPVYKPPKLKETKKRAYKPSEWKRAIWVDGVKYESMAAAVASIEGLTTAGLGAAVTKGHNSYKGHTLKYAGCAGKTPAPSARAVVVDGVRYASISLAANIMRLQEGHGTNTALASALRRGQSKYLGHTIAYAPSRV